MRSDGHITKYLNISLWLPLHMFVYSPSTTTLGVQFSSLSVAFIGTQYNPHVCCLVMACVSLPVRVLCFAEFPGTLPANFNFFCCYLRLAATFLCSVWDSFSETELTLWRGLAGLTIRKKTSVYCLWFLRLNCCNFCWLCRGRRIQGQFSGWFLTRLRVNCRAEFLCFYSSIKLFMSVAVLELFLRRNAQEADCLQLQLLPRSKLLRSSSLFPPVGVFWGKSDEFLLPHFCSTFLHLHRRRIFISL